MKFLVTLAAAMTLCSAAVAAPTAEVPIPAEKPRIDMVFCIDCSGSMGAVIETAKQKIWAIVNEVGKAKPAPVLRIGLLGYGNSDISYRMFELSDDLDEVYKHLVTFKDEGWGNEWVGRAIQKATTDMKWSPSNKDLKVIYVVGNETAKQGPPEMQYDKTAPAAIKAGIMVNAIYCGTQGNAGASAEITATWREFAQLADGQFMAIERTGGAVVVQSPFDKRLDELSKQVNTTYLAFGQVGRDRKLNQEVQDRNAGSFGGAVAADRALSKAGAQYNASARLWDLVEASKQKDFDWKTIKDEDLPEEMRKMSLAERKAYVQKKDAERAKIQKEIQDLAVKRDAFIREEITRQGLKGDHAFDEAVRRSVTQQAQKKGFKFETPAPAPK